MDFERDFRWFEVTLKGPDMKPKSYHFRCLSWGEWNAALTRETETEIDEFILKKCVKNYQPDVDLEGTCQTLLFHIKKLSGYDEDQLTLTQAENWILDPDGVYEAVGIAVLGLNPTYLRNCDPLDRAKCLIVGKITFENMTGKTVEEGFVTVGDAPDAQMSQALEAAQAKGHIGGRDDVFYAQNGGYDSRRGF